MIKLFGRHARTEDHDGLKIDEVEWKRRSAHN